MIRRPLLYIVLVQLIILFLLSGCSGSDKQNQEQELSKKSVDFLFESTSVTLPLPSSVQLEPGGRFYSRYQGNVNYLKYQHKHYGHEMLDAFASRHYAPGKLLERIWDGEYAGKWLDAATRVAVNTRMDDLLKMVDTFAASLRAHQQPDGYMGIKLPTGRKLNEWEKSWDNWNQWNCMIGFLTHYELRGEKASLEAAANIAHWIITTFDPEKDDEGRFLNCEVTSGMTNAVIIGQLMRLYQHTGNSQLLAFVDNIIQHYSPIKHMLASGEPFLFHPYMLGAVLNGVLRFAEATEDAKMLSRVEQVWQGLIERHMFPTGSLGESEDLDAGSLEDVPGGQLQETCATTEWIFLTQKLYSVTGRAKYIDALEKTCYNALLAAQSTDGMKWCYWTPLRYSKDWFHGPTRCCFWSGPRGIARLPQLIYAVKENNLYINFFESSHASLNTTSGKVDIVQLSRFPDEGKSEIIIKTPAGWKGILSVRVPEWSENITLEKNGHIMPVEDIINGYSHISLTGAREYEIGIQFDIPLIMEQLTGDEYVICHGPEILSVDIRDNIDTWLGQDDLISLPGKMAFHPVDEAQWDQWAGPADPVGNRRRYLVKVHDARTDALRGVIVTPYADAGNEGAAFRTVFPLAHDR